MESSRYIPYTGQWTNYATNEWIWTLDGYHADILSAALVMWVTYVAICFWYILRFILHQCISRHPPPSFLIDQTGVAIRTSDSFAAMAWSTIKIMCRWLKPFHANRRHIFSLLALCVFSTVMFVGWSAAGLCVPRISTRATDSVLIQPNKCGSITWDNAEDPTQNVAFTAYTINRTEMAENRVNQCSETSVDLTACGVLPQPYISWEGTDSTCFLADKESCITENSVPYRLITRPIHSSRDLGINTAKESEVTISRSTECSPIHTGDYVTIYNETNTILYPNGTRWQQFNFGPYGNNSFTYIYNEWTPSFPFVYDVSAVCSNPGYTFEPNKTFFNREDASLSLIFVSGGHIRYQTKVDDPIFNASTQRPYIPPDGDEGKAVWYYNPSYFVNVIACIDQWQICNPSLGEAGCSPLMRNDQLKNASFELTDLQFNIRQREIIGRIVYAIHDSPISQAIGSRGGSSLLANRYVTGDISPGLPSDQWRRELGHWYSILLAKLQQDIVDFAAGPRDDTLDPYIMPPQTSSLESQCKSQVIRAGAILNVQNFLLKPIIIVAVLGVVIIVLGLSIDTITAMFRRNDSYLQILWEMHSPYHLHRGVGEGLGMHFTHTNRSIPRSEDEAIMVDTRNPKHPRYGVPFQTPTSTTAHSAPFTVANQSRPDRVSGHFSLSSSPPSSRQPRRTLTPHTMAQQRPPLRQHAQPSPPPIPPQLPLLASQQQSAPALSDPPHEMATLPANDSTARLLPAAADFPRSSLRSQTPSPSPEPSMGPARSVDLEDDDRSEV